MNDLAKKRAEKERKRLIIEAQRRRHLREVNAETRRDREAKEAKRAQKARKRADQRVADLKRRADKVAKRRRWA